MIPVRPSPFHVGRAWKAEAQTGIVERMPVQTPEDLVTRVAACFDALAVPPDAPLVAAVSGGPDSMALLDVLTRHAGWRKNLQVGHVDHGLRAESAAEAAFVAEQCRARGVPYAATRLSVTGEGENLAARLRHARYEFLRSLVAPGGYLLTAHHADDQAVTMLMRFIEGAALPGLRGMRTQRDDIIRPFLGVERRALLAWLEANRVPYCSDPSNEDTAKFRNRVRKHIWPLVLHERPGAAETLARSAQRLQEDDDALNEWANRLAESVAFGEGWVEIGAEGAAAPPAVLRRLLAIILQNQWDTPPLNGEQWQDVLAALRQGRRANLPGRVTLERHPPGLLLLGEHVGAPFPALDISAAGDYLLPVGRLSVTAVTRQTTVRPLQAGDRFPDGKRVVDKLGARGLPWHRRAGYPVVTDPASGFVWCAPSPEAETVPGVGEFAYTPHSFRGVTRKKVMAPQIVKGAIGTL
jgi:tRNA(Ile)-lysidine synthase